LTAFSKNAPGYNPGDGPPPAYPPGMGPAQVPPAYPQGQF